MINGNDLRFYSVSMYHELFSQKWTSNFYCSSFIRFLSTSATIRHINMCKAVDAYLRYIHVEEGLDLNLLVMSLHYTA